MIQGSERVALIGRNGVGKTTLLEQVVASVAHNSGDSRQNSTNSAENSPESEFFRSCAHDTRTAHRAPRTDRIGYLPQRIDGIVEAHSVVENIAEVAPEVPDKELRNRLARFLIRGGTADKAVSSLSGGERFRVALGSHPAAAHRARV